MNPRRRSFIRKIVYITTVALLLLPLSWLSRPATTKEGGGKLAELREQYGLSQASLGEIDPASETIKLATLGMRGIAADILWVQANHYKKVEDWTNLSATLEQITKLQPNFISVWSYQGWNLAYNVSVEFDNYRDRYYWVIRGIKFLKEGMNYNSGEPRLLWDVGWTIGNKIGRADERFQYRKMFKEDDDFHNSDRIGRPRSQRDNWLVAREKYLAVIDLVDRLGKSMKGKEPLLYYADPGISQLNYGEALFEEGVFNEVAQAAWRRASAGWTEYGNRDIPTSYNVGIRLNDKERYDARAAQFHKELERLVPNIDALRKKIRAERFAKLAESDRKALERPRSDFHGTQLAEVLSLESLIMATDGDVANAVEGPNRALALQAAEASHQAARVADIIDRYRDIINFNYWKMRCRFEQTEDALAARRLVYEGGQAISKARLRESQDLYEQGLRKWRTVLDKHPDMLAYDIMVEDLMDMLEEYREMLNQADAKVPEPFVLADVLAAGKAAKAAQAGNPLPPPESSPAGKAPAATATPPVAPPAASPPSSSSPPAAAAPDAKVPADSAPPKDNPPAPAPGAAAK